MSLSDYVVTQVIGKGAFGEVWRCDCKTDGKVYVMKKIAVQNDSFRKSAEAEVRTLLNLNHPNIVRYKDCVIDSNNFHIIMEYCDGGDMAKRIADNKQNSTRFPEDQIIYWTLDICSALQYIHSLGIIHRDLKPQNIFLTMTNELKIGDFGVSRQLNPGSLASTVTGTPLYVSPEIVAQQKYDTKADVWSLGCCVYELMTLRPAIDVVRCITMGVRLVEPMPTDFSPELTSLTQQMLTNDPAIRPSVKDILDSAFMQTQAASRQGLPLTISMSSVTATGRARPNRPRKQDYTSVSQSTGVPYSHTLVSTVLLPPPKYEDTIVPTAPVVAASSPNSSQPVASPPSLPTSTPLAVPVKATSVPQSNNNKPDLEMTTPGGITVLVYKGNLVNERVEAIVSPVNSQLDPTGGAAKAIMDTAGSKVLDECKDYIKKNKKLNVTEVMHTSAGNLSVPIRYIIHAAGPPAKDYPDETKQRAAVFATFLNVLRHANDELKITSLSVPAISSGTFEVPRVIVAEEAYKALMTFDAQCGTQRSVKSVYYLSVNPETVKTFVKTFSDRQKK
jgi:serine/threonine protein kinase